MRYSVLRPLVAASLIAAALSIQAQTTLISTGAVWKYLDDGTEPGAAWRGLAYDDGAWASGPAQLGYGDGDEATRINSGTATNVFLTYYFRHAFEVANPGDFSNLVVRVVRDDGVVVYLNGTEVFRNNMPAGPINGSTPAAEIVNSPQESQFYSTRLSPALLQSGPNVIAVEVHQGNNTSSDVSFDLELLSNIPASPPVVEITAPLENADYVAPADVSIFASATDFDGVVTNVQFLVDGAGTGHDSSESYSLTCASHPTGTHVLHAVATDDSGLVATSAPVRIHVVEPALVVNLVTNGSFWRYLDNNADPIELWKQSNYPDHSWKLGRGQFGYNEGDEETRIEQGTPSYIAHYFRHRFVVDRAADFTNLLFNVLRDDGVVMYLNGAEIFRMNMPTGEITRLTPAAGPVGGTNEWYYFPTNISTSLLVDGTNTLAMELHQTVASADASFDMNLIGIGPPRGSVIRLLLEQTADQRLLRWDAQNVVLEQTPVPGWNWITLSNAVSPYEIPAGGGSRLFRLRQR